MAELCAITESIKVIGTKPRLLIVRNLDGNASRNKNELGFNELKKLCELSSRTLALNLGFLVKRRIVQVREEKNRRFYSLTKGGAELSPILNEVGKWGKKWSIYN